jgi:hypothetical protein
MLWSSCHAGELPRAGQQFQQAVLRRWCRHSSAAGSGCVRAGRRQLGVFLKQAQRQPDQSSKSAALKAYKRA